MILQNDRVSVMMALWQRFLGIRGLMADVEVQQLRYSTATEVSEDEARAERELDDGFGFDDKINKVVSTLSEDDDGSDALDQASRGKRYAGRRGGDLDDGSDSSSSASSASSSVLFSRGGKGSDSTCTPALIHRRLVLLLQSIECVYRRSYCGRRRSGSR
tara:strand:- start:892 stop:1371 length:480 start_codon:yes stop_codon:yes gene_type:complete